MLIKSYGKTFLLIMNLVWASHTVCMDSLLKPLPLAIAGTAVVAAVTASGLSYKIMTHAKKSALTHAQAQSQAALRQALADAQTASEAQALKRYNDGQNDGLKIAGEIFTGARQAVAPCLQVRKQEFERIVTEMYRSILECVGLPGQDNNQQGTTSTVINSAGVIAAVQQYIDQQKGHARSIGEEEGLRVAIAQVAAHINASCQDMKSLKDALNAWLETNKQLVRDEKAASIMQQVQQALGQSEAFSSELEMLTAIRTKLPAIAQAEQAVRATVLQRFGVTSTQASSEQLNSEIDAWMQRNAQRTKDEIESEIEERVELKTLIEVAQLLGAQVADGVTVINKEEYKEKLLRAAVLTVGRGQVEVIFTAAAQGAKAPSLVIGNCISSTAEKGNNPDES